MKMVNVRFNESVSLGSRVFAHGEEHVVSEEDANRLGSSLTVLGDAPNDFPAYDKSVYGDNEAAREREPQAPSELEPVEVGAENPNETPERADDKKALDQSPRDKQVKGAQVKK